MSSALMIRTTTAKTKTTILRQLQVDGTIFLANTLLPPLCLLAFALLSFFICCNFLVQKKIGGVDGPFVSFFVSPSPGLLHCLH